jgi:cardiolipin synthase A/B
MTGTTGIDRVFVLLPSGANPRAAWTLSRWLRPAMDHVTCVIVEGASLHAVASHLLRRGASDEATRTDKRLRRLAKHDGVGLTVRCWQTASEDALVEALGDSPSSLLITVVPEGWMSAHVTRAAALAGRRRGVPVVWLPQGVHPTVPDSVVVVHRGEPGAMVPIVHLLNHVAEVCAVHVYRAMLPDSLLLPVGAVPFRAPVTEHDAPDSANPFRKLESLQALVASVDAGLVVVPSWGAGTGPWLEAIVGPWVAPQLGVPVAVAPDWRRLDSVLPSRIEVSDAALVGGRLWLTAELSSRVGLPTRPPPGLVVSAGDEVLGRLLPDGRGVACAASAVPEAIDLGYPRAAGAPRVVREATSTVVRLDLGQWVLVDAALGPEAVKKWAAKVRSTSGLDVVAVRTDGERSLRELRLALSAAVVGRRVCLLCVRSLLDDGGPDELPSASGPARLARVGRWLRAQGVSVRGVVVAGSGPVSLGADVWTARDLFGAPWSRGRSPGALGVGSPEAQLDAWVPSTRSVGNRLEIQGDNRRAREVLLDAIEGAKRSVSIMAFELTADTTTRSIAAALAAAAERGVDVRVLLDPVASSHKFAGTRNAVAAELEAAEGVEILLSRVPNVSTPRSLKERDHRKLTLVDGATAFVGGRNLGWEYYTGFDEIVVTEQTPFDAVPFQDLGVALQGPAVQQLSHLFEQFWVRAGGVDRHPDAAEGPEGGQAGESAGSEAGAGQGPAHNRPGPAAARAVGGEVRLVVHEPMQDTHTLDVYRTLIESAHTSLFIVNTFPVQFELLRALERAMERGVTVELLFGNFRPRYGAGPGQAFTGGQMRELADVVVQGRLERLARSGAQIYEYAVARQPGWDRAIDPLRPHVHAKLMVADDRVCTVGSANLDITAAYWDAELLLVVSDVDFATQMMDTLRAWADASLPWHPDASTSRRLVSDHWPSVLG